MNLEEDIKKYVASFDDVLSTCGNDTFLAQKHYYTQDPKRESTFDPFMFFASNIKEIIKNNVTIVLHKKTPTKIPKKVSIRCGDANYTILVRGESSGSILTDLFINSKLLEISYSRHSFPSQSYHSQHYEMIDLYFSQYPNRLSDSHITNAARFYVEYGFWNNIELQHVNGYRYIASVPEFIQGFNRDIKPENIDFALEHYFHHENKLLFSPSLYAASNWSRLSDFQNEKTKCINTERVSMHYITKGAHEKLSIKSFNHWQYLADNVECIKELLKVNDHNKIHWDIVKLTPTRTAELFIKRNAASKKDFNAEEFVKMYVSDTDINYDKKMCLETASQYFVKGYATNSTVRWRTTLGYFSLEFLRNRMHDMIRQMPLHVLRCIFFPKM